MRSVLLIILFISLTSCATSKERGEYIANHIEKNFGPTCIAMGYKRDTDKYRDCKLSLYNSDTQRAGAAAATQIKQ